jgi:hypothetical protein
MVSTATVSGNDRVTHGRPGFVLAAAAAAPFVAGRLGGALITGDGALAGHVLCPLRAATGIPCPLCGATRSVVLASRGDMAFLHLNAVWVLVLAALVLGGLALAAADAAGITVPRGRVPARAWWAAGAVLGAVGWACALWHRQAIAGA